MTRRRVCQRCMSIGRTSQLRRSGTCTATGASTPSHRRWMTAQAVKLPDTLFPPFYRSFYLSFLLYLSPPLSRKLHHTSRKCCLVLSCPVLSRCRWSGAQVGQSEGGSSGQHGGGERISKRRAAAQGSAHWLHLGRRRAANGGKLWRRGVAATRQQRGRPLPIAGCY